MPLIFGGKPECNDHSGPATPDEEQAHPKALVDHSGPASPEEISHHLGVPYLDKPSKPHDFIHFSPEPGDIMPTVPVIFCRRCGMTLELSPVENSCEFESSPCI